MPTIKISKRFSEFLKEDNKTYQEKIIELMRLNNPEMYKSWMAFKERQ